ncbi:MAG: hypothetical protein LBQ44_00215 [Treponema sp.]|nr:hypothetical protein [Treponema sp.]
MAPNESLETVLSEVLLVEPRLSSMEAGFSPVGTLTGGYTSELPCPLYILGDDDEGDEDDDMDGEDDFDDIDDAFDDDFDDDDYDDDDDDDDDFEEEDDFDYEEDVDYDDFDE